MAEKTIRIRMRRGVVGGDFVYSAGGEYDAPEHIALDLIKAEHADRIDENATQKAENTGSKQAHYREKR